MLHKLVLPSLFISALLLASTPVLADTCTDQVPTLTGNTSAVATSGVYSSSYPAWKAFDSAVTGSSMWISETWETPAWISYNFGSNRVINRYSITNTNGSSLTSRAPKDFKLQGWNGSSWTTVDTRTNQTGWTSGVARTYQVQTPGSYSKYRLHITDDNDSRSGIVVISIGDLQFQTCGCSSTVDQVPTLSGSSLNVTTSGTYSSSYPAWKAFDSGLSGSSMWISETWETPAWISYNFGSNRLVTQYTLRNTNGSLTSRAPKDFKLQGWNGSSWITVDTRTNQTGWVSGTPRTYNVSTPGYFSRYRLRITDDNDSRAGVVVISLHDVQFRGCQGTTSSPLNVNLQCLSTSAGDQHACFASTSGGSTPYLYNWSYVGDGFMQSSGDSADVYINSCTGSLNRISVTVTDNAGATDSAIKTLFCDDCGGRICPVLE